MEGVLHNPILITIAISWITAQMLKFFYNLITMRQWDWTRLIGAGGMPSAHSAFVVSLMISTGIRLGWDSPYFALGFALAAVVMYDAAGVRRAAGRQAKAINEIVRSLQKSHKIPEEKLKELLGHTPIEVIAGALLGAMIAILVYRYGIG